MVLTTFSKLRNRNVNRDLDIEIFSSYLVFSRRNVREAVNMIRHAQYVRSMFVEIGTLSLILIILLVPILDEHTDTKAHRSHMLYSCQHKIIMQTYGLLILLP